MKNIIKKIIPKTFRHYLKDKIREIDFFKKKFRKFYLKKLLVFPLQVTIEVTSFCNAKCLHCEHGQLGRPYAHMKMDLYEKIIDECYKFKKYCKGISLFWMGEPLLDPNFFEKVKYAKQKKCFFISTYSNGSLLTPENCKKLIDSGIDKIVFSVDGATKESFEKIRTALFYEKVVEGIKRLAKLRKSLNSKKPQIEVQLILTPFNEKELDLFKRTWKGVADLFYAKKMHTWTQDTIDKDLLDYSRKLIKKQKTRFSPCFYLWKSMVVAQDGRVALCCVDPRIQEQIGDFKKETIYEVWHGSKLRKIRELHLANKMNEISACHKCNFREIKEYPWWWYEYKK